MMKKTIAALASTLVLAGACKEPLGAPNEDAPVLGAPVTAQNLVGGVVSQGRVNGSSFAYLLFPEGFARNALRTDPNEGRYVGELIAVPFDPSDFIGASGWTGFFQGIRSANQAIANPAITGLQAGDRNAVVGLVQTLKALEYIRALQLRDTLGIPIQTAAIKPPDPLRTKTSVLTFVSALLDSGYANLTAGGVDATIPVSLPSGYTLHGDFTQTANLALFNRGLKGEAEVYRLLDHQSPCATCAQTAITALTTAIGGTTATASGLAFGPYYEYNPNAPESFARPLADNKIYVTDNWVQSIQTGDARAAKAVKSSTPSATNVLLTPLTYQSPLTNPSDQTSPLPIRRAAMWYLLRAQAEAESGQLAAATADVNVVHTGEGKLAPIAPLASVAAAHAAILYEYRYSFLFEGPHHLTMLRAYSGLTKAYVTQPGMPTATADPTHATDPLSSALPIPIAEQLARNNNTTPIP
ncbi:hypothetical protein tb265_33340 [Gemmatimonadetes bacterium T265]|nr:hypothetical protein tb265_33340 [Gemmatimonadetes bacterium T265]